MSRFSNTFKKRNINDDYDDHHNDEDDLQDKLLKQQNEFLKSGEKPSAQVSRKPPPLISSKKDTNNNATTTTTTTTATKPTSKLVAPKKTMINNIPVIDDFVEKDIISLADDINQSNNNTLPKKTTTPTKNVTSNSFMFNGPIEEQVIERDPEDIIDDHDHHITSILHKIYERDVSDSLFEPPKKKTTSFPQPLHRSLKSFSNKQQQQVQQEQPQKIENYSLQNEIDKENREKIDSMSEQEIKENQDYLLKNIDPKLLEMLKSRSNRKKGNIEIKKTNQNNNNNNENDKTLRTTAFDTMIDDLHQENEKRVKDKIQQKQQVVEVDDDYVDMKDSQETENTIDDTKWMANLDDTDKLGKHFEETIQNFLDWRFGFNGEIIKRGVDLPTHLALHHHGDEAAEAGYTLSELVMLIKSTNSSQKAMALSILSQILTRIQNRKYHIDHVRSVQLDHIYQLKLPRLLRVVLDSNIPTVLKASISAIHSLVVSTNDNESLQSIENRVYRGYESISTKPFESVAPKVQSFVPQEEHGEEQDDDDTMCRKDIVQGLISMGILNRIRFLLDRKMTATIAENDFYLVNASLLVDILIRFARHSQEISTTISKCHYLYDTLLNILQIESNNNNSNNDSILVLKSKVIQLFTTISQSSRQLAVGIWSKFSTPVNSLFNDPTSNQMIVFEILKIYQVMAVYKIQLEYFNQITGKLLQVIGEFTNYINEFSHDFSVDKQSESQKRDLVKFNQQFRLSKSIFNLLDVLIQSTQENNIKEYDRISRFIDQCFVLFSTIPVIYQSIKESEIKNIHYNLNIIGLYSSVLQFTTSYLQSTQYLMSKTKTLSYNQFKFINNNNQPESSTFTIIDLMEQSTTTIFQSLLNTTLYTDLRKLILSIDDGQNSVTSQSLMDGEICQFWSSVARYFYLVTKINRSITHTLFYLGDGDFFTQLHSILVSTMNYSNLKIMDEQDRCGLSLLLANQRSRTYLYYYIIKLMNEARLSSDFDISLNRYHHSAAMALVSNFLPGDDQLLLDIFQSTIFQQDYLNSIGCTKVTSVSNIYIDFYKEKFLPQNTIDYSNSYQFIGNLTPNTLMISFETFESLLPLKYDWYNLSIEYLYKSSQELKQSKKNTQHDDFGWEDDDDEDDEGESEQTIHPLVEVTLIFIHSLFNNSSNYIKSISLENVYQTLMKVFLVKKDPWENVNISKLLEQLLKVLNQSLLETRKEEREDDPNVRDEYDFVKYFGDKFYQFFTDFVSQFVSSSNSSPIFSRYLVLFARQYYPLQYRKLIWSELFPTLHYLRILNSNELPLGEKGYLEPYEASLDMIQIYKNAIIQQKSTPTKAPVLYKIAKTHLTNYIFIQQQPYQSVEEKIKDLQSNNVKREIVKEIYESKDGTTILKDLFGEDTFNQVIEFVLN